MFQTKIFAVSSQGLPILSYVFGSTGPVALILGGVHGDEPEGNYIALGLLKKWMQNFPYKLKVYLVPSFNIEGSLTAQRANANQVDLNRNLPTKNWTSQFKKERYHPGPKACSEAENKHLVEWINNNPVKLILSLHSWNPMINTNGNCLPEASIMAKAIGYKLTDDIGYPTPGSLGDYCGLERDIPVITYEAERGESIKQALNKHVPAIEKALFETEKRS
ncbi:MAG: M14 family zinc carboxypeptidase [Oligoflexia bacterium]|nr:M14 family zinc carboxypeptidase [Oligoflexia bacterium]